MDMACPGSGGEALVFLSAALAAQIAAGRGEDELVVLAAFLTALADNLALIAAQRAAQANLCAQAEGKNAQAPCGKGENPVELDVK